MRIFKTLVAVALAADVAVGSIWGTRAAYNKWHETELERWLSDHDVPYPTPADRRDLEKLVEKNWNSHVVEPYKNWDTDQLTAYLKLKGVETKNGAINNKDALTNQVQGVWYETEDKAQNAWTSVKDWILDSWTESQLKAFCDHHGIPVPQPRQRDTILQKARSSYETIAQKAGEVTAYPGNWLYDTWTDSDLKEFLDTHGIPAPQPSTRDKLIASVRRNSRLAYLRMQDQAASATKSAEQAYSTLSDIVINAWSESQLKDFCDKNSIPVPQGTKLDELRALVRKHRAEFLGDTISQSAESAYGAATSKAGNQYAKATDSASIAAKDAFYQAVDTWSESRLKAYLDARGVPIPQNGKKDELRALVRKNSHKAASGWSAWTFDDMSIENLKRYLSLSEDTTAQKAAKKAGATRDDLVKAAHSAYSSASKTGGANYASATNFLAKATQGAKDSVFDTWTESELKSYLDSYGVPVPQGSKVNELRAFARKQSTYFKYGTSTPSETVFAKLSDSAKNAWDWIMSQVNAGATAAEKTAGDAKKNFREEL